MALCNLASIWCRFKPDDRAILRVSMYFDSTTLVWTFFYRYLSASCLFYLRNREITGWRQVFHGRSSCKVPTPGLREFNLNHYHEQKVDEYIVLILVMNLQFQNCNFRLIFCSHTLHIYYSLPWKFFWLTHFVLTQKPHLSSYTPWAQQLTSVCKNWIKTISCLNFGHSYICSILKLHCLK